MFNNSIRLYIFTRMAVRTRIIKGSMLIQWGQQRLQLRRWNQCNSLFSEYGFPRRRISIRTDVFSENKEALRIG